MFQIRFLQNVAKSAAVSSRYTDSSLRGVIQVEGLFSPGLFIDFFPQDIHMLSISDFLVCTFSSQVVQFIIFVNYREQDFVCVTVHLLDLLRCAGSPMS